MRWMQSNESGPRSLWETQPRGEETGLGAGVPSNSWDGGPWVEPKQVSWALGPLGRGGGGPRGGWAGPGRPTAALGALTILSSFLRAMVLECQGCRLLRQGWPVTSRTFKHN